MQTAVSQVATLTLNPAIDHSVMVPGFRPNAVNRVAGEALEAGGKGVNVAAYLADCGVPVSVAGFLGSDNAEVFEALFARQGLRDHFVRLPGKTRVNLKIVDEARGSYTDINFKGFRPAAEHEATLWRVLEALLVHHEWFVISGSLPEGLRHDFTREVATFLKAKGKRVALDASGPPLKVGLSAQPDLIKPNREELEELLGTALETPAKLLSAARGLVADGIGHVIVSIGGQGAIYVNPAGAWRAQPPDGIPVRSTVGAGDAMVAGFILGQLEDRGSAETIRLAMAFAQLVVQQVGRRSLTRADLDAMTPRIRVEAV